MRYVTIDWSSTMASSINLPTARTSRFDLELVADKDFAEFCRMELTVCAARDGNDAYDEDKEEGKAMGKNIKFGWNKI